MRIRGAYGKKDVQSSPQTLGERLRRIRIAWGWSQGRFAEALGSNQRLVSHWERDIVKPSGAALTAISSLIGMTTEALLTGKGFTIPDIPAGVEGVNREKGHPVRSPCSIIAEINKGLHHRHGHRHP